MTQEWIGGRVLLPFYVMEGAPSRPEAILWLERPSDVIVHAHLGAQGESPGALGSGLVAALRQPKAGPPRVPGQIRVASEALATEVRATAGVPSDLPIVVAPTPELGGIVARMSEHLATHEVEGTTAPTYLEGGRVPAERVGAMFHAAARLYRLAPWDLADDDQVLRLDVPALGVEGAVVSIIGALGQSLGLILFESMDAFRALLSSNLREMDERALTTSDVDLGSSVMALDFVDAEDLAPEMVKEARKNRWAMPAQGIYPVVTRRDRDGLPRPTSEVDVRLATAAAVAVSALVEQHPDVFDAPPDSPLLITPDDPDACGARLTVDPALRADTAEGPPQDADDDDAELRRMLTFDGRPRLHVPLDSWRMHRPMGEPIRSSDVENALKAMELAIRPERRAKKPQLDPSAILHVHGAALSLQHRARAEALHRSVFAAAGQGGALVESALLELLGPGSPASSIGFWTETLRLTRSRDGFGPDRRRLALAALARMAEGTEAALVDQIVDAILVALEADSATTRSDALDALSQLDQSARPKVPARGVAALERTARTDHAFLPRFRARRILDWMDRPPVAEEGTFTLAITMTGVRGFRVSIEAAADQHLDDLQHALHREIRWDQDHLWSFYLGGDCSSRRSDLIEIGLDGESPYEREQLSLGRLGLVVGQKLLYHFDFGDDHRFDVRVTAHDPEAMRRAKYPRIVDRKGTTPKQYRW